MDENRLEQMPHTIGRYQIQESIGYGAMGAVYRAFDPLIKRTLAIKTIRLDIPRQSPQYKSFIERFYHEARISGTLSHPNIVTLFDIGEEGGIPYLAMEFVEGDTISGILERGQKFNPERVINLVSQIAAAVDYAHSKGVIHRDIKPSNLILYEGERVKVTDFGIAKLVDAEMTQSGTLLGTPSYMSPEQAMGDKLDGRSDIFSLGVCAFEMLCGEQPFPGNNVTSILYKLVHVDPILPANLEMNGLVPQKWHEVFGRVLAKKPDDRYQTATDFVQDLEYCLGAWFGSAMGDETATDSASEPGQSATDATRAFAAVDIPPPAAAPVPPSLSEASAPGTGARPAAAPVLPPDESAPSPTVHMKADPEIAAPRTAAYPEPKYRPDSATPSAPAAPVAAPATESTVLLNKIPTASASPTSDARPPSDEPATVLIKKVDAARPAPPAPAAPPQEKTIVMDAASLGTAKGRPAAPTSAPLSPQEKTVMMGSVSQPTSGDLTVKAPLPGATLKQPAPDVRRVTPPPVPPPPTQRQAPRPAAPSGPVPVSAPLSPAAGPPDATPPPPSKGMPLGLILGGIGVLLFLFAIGGGLLLYRKFASSVAPIPSPSVPPTTQAQVPTPEPTVAPVAVTGTLRVESQPAGATVTVDGESRGVTPLDLSELTAGPHEVKLELKGFSPSVQKIEITEQSPRAELKLALARVAAVTGAIDFLSTPPGASIILDGAPLGQTPLLDQKLKPGTLQVEMRREGYEPWSGSVTVVAGKRARVEAPLNALPRATPTPAPETVDANRIYLNVPSSVESPTGVDVVAKRVSGLSPSYPTDRAPRLRPGDSVSVTISYVITEQGEVTELKVMESGGKVLDEEVTKAVAKWKYSPAVKKGVKVKVRATFKSTFKAG